MKHKERIKRVFSKITIPQWIKKFFRERFFDFAAVVLIALLLVILASLIVRIIGNESHWLDDWLGTDRKSNAKYQTLRSLALLSAGLGGLLGLFISNRRAKAQAESVKEQAKSVDAQVKANENTTFHEAIKHLGDLSASVRLGGIYALYDLALFNSEKRLKNIIEILSAHVRETTQKDEYKKEYKTKPSNEISSLLKLLSDLNTNYLSENEEAKSSPLDLSHAYLCGVILQEVDFRKAFFIRSNFKGAILERSHFESAYLDASHFESAYLDASHFEDADLYAPHFEGAYLRESHFVVAHLERSHFEGAYLYASHFKGAYLFRSHFEGADLAASHIEGAYDDQYRDIDNFINRIQKRTGKKANIGNMMFFAGGITEEYMKDLKKIIENALLHFTLDNMREEFNKRMNSAIERLKSHQDQPISYEIPKYLKEYKLLGELTKEKADEIIQRYKEAIKKHNEIIKKIQINQ